MPFGDIPVKLLRSQSAESEDSDLEPSLDNDRLEENELMEFACTFNIAGNRRVNRRKWSDYDPANQLQILVKSLNSHCLSTNVVIDWSRFVIEQCPSSNNIHIHCVLFVLHNEDIGDLVININQKFSPSDYLIFKADPLYYPGGWNKYIRKNCVSNI